MVTVEELTNQAAEELGISKKVAHWAYYKSIYKTMDEVVDFMLNSDVELSEERVKNIRFRIPKVGTFRINYKGYINNRNSKQKRKQCSE